MYFTFQALHKHLKEEGYAYLGLPYWNWVKNMTIPTIFDGLIVSGLPNMVDRMIDIKRGNNKRLPIKVCGLLNIYGTFLPPKVLCHPL